MKTGIAFFALFLSACIATSFATALAVSPGNLQKSIDQARKQIQQKHFEQAEKPLQVALTQAAGLPANDMKRVEIFNLLLEVFYGENKLVEACDVFAKLLPILKHNYGAHDRDYARALHNYAREGWGYVDKNGEVAIEPNFKEADDFSEGLAAVDGGYINTKGRMVISLKSFSHKPFSEGLAAVILGPGD